MIVEDDRIIAEDIKITLEKFGYNVSSITAFGEDAIKRAKVEKPDLVLMDIILKGKMTGIEAVKKIISKENIPVVFLTAYADKKTIEKVKLTGPFGYIIKPFEENELFSIIEIALYKHQLESQLRRRDAILEAITFGAKNFLKTSNWEVNIDEFLGYLGTAIDVSRAFIFENFNAADGRLIMRQRFGWSAPGIEPQILVDEYQNLPYIQAGFGKWIDVLSSGEVLWGHTQDFPKNVQRIFNERDIKSIIAVPIFSGEDWWGFIGLDECRTERDWIKIDTDGLKIAADVLGTAIHNYHTQEELVRLSTAVKMSTDCITILDMEGKIIDVNDAVLELFGVKDREVFIGKNYIDLMLPEERRRAVEVFKNIYEKGYIKNSEFSFKLTSGEIVIIETTASLMRNSQGELIGIVAITRDVTERKAAELEMKRRLMRYELEEGYLYLFKEPTLSKALDGFNDLIKVGYNGYILSRTTKNRIKNKIKSDHEYEFIWLSETGKINSISPELQGLEDWLNNLKRGSVILLDRLDYLIHQNGFKKALTFIQRLAELAYLNNLIVLSILDPGTVDHRELRMLEKECSEVKPMITVDLEEDLLETVKYVYEMNLVGVKPTFSQVEHELKISKPTVRKRIADLKNRGLLMDLRKGSSKVVEITDKGKAIFKK
jgi:PAS domain S-box-containing protein